MKFKYSSILLLFIFLQFSAENLSAQQTYLDTFSNTSYSNNNGTQNFSGNWIESNDDNDPDGGNIRVRNNALRFRKIDDERIQRNLNLSGASSVTLTFDYDGSDRGGETLLVQLWNGSSWQTVSTLNNTNSGSITYSLITNQISSSSSIRFVSGSGKWGNNDTYYIDNVQFAAIYGPTITIDNITVNEDAGSLSFIATAGGAPAGSSFTVAYQTIDITATSGSDYTAVSNTMTFNGSVGDTETITVPILDDILLENVETFSIQMTSSSNPSADITDTATGTIVDDDSIIMTNSTTSNECGTVFLDPGGLNNYGNNENVVHTLCPEPGSDYVTVEFTSFDIEAGFDFLYIYDGNSTGATLIGQYDNNNVPSTIAASPGNGCLTFRFTSDNSVNGAGFQADIKCFQEGPRIVIDDVSVDEDAGTAVFTVTSTRARHGRNFFLIGFVDTPFTVNYTTVDGSALSGSDYTATSGTLNFNGSIGHQRTISVPINNDGIPELAENFTVEFTSVNAPDAQVNYDDTGIGTINSQILANDPLTLFKGFDGEFDYTSTGGTLRTQSNGANACSITTSSSNTLTSPIPNTGTVEAAYLYWAHSSFNRDEQVIFEGQAVNASFVYQTTLTNRNFYGYVSDVTSLVQGIPNISTNVFDFSGLSIDTSNTYCGSATVLGGWSLMVFYEDPNLPAVNINLYQGFDGLSNEGTSFTLDSFYAIAGSGAKATFLSWEGDDTLDGNTGTNPEALSITNQAGATFNLTGDGGNPGNNAYNSTIYDNTTVPIYNTPNIYGVDLDTYDISSFILPGDTQVTANVDMGQDFVINMAVVLKVPSNLIAGSVFEDINYPGGGGRSMVASSGVGVSGAIVELFQSNGTFIERKNSDINGNYAFAGMPDGDYLIKVVNSSVSSTRGGGLNCNDCFPIQTFRSYGTAAAITEVTSEIGGADPSATQDAALGILVNAQSVSSASVASNGVTGVDFGFNFNTIVNTNVDGQGSLEQFILNSNNLDEVLLDVEANSLFDPAAGEDISIFMIPPTSDPLGRSADGNFANGYFDIEVTNNDPLSIITGSNTIIDGRTQTAYSGDTNTGVLGSGGSNAGVSNVVLPDYNRPEIQVHRDNGDVFKTEGNDIGIRNISIFANDNSGIRVDAGSLSVIANIIGMDATGVTTINLNGGIENVGGDLIVDGNYIANTGDYAISVDGGASNIIQNNQLVNNGNAPCDDAIIITGGSGIQILQNLIETSASTAIDGEASTGNIIISENSLTTSGQDGGDCSGNPQQMAIKLAGDGSEITNNKIFTNGGAGITIVDGTSNLISQNSIYANGTSGDALGIDLDDDGVTLNDNADGDSGPNGLENFPVISGAYLAGNTLVVTGWAASGTTVEVFFTDINEGTAVSGDNQLGLMQDYGEGQVFIGTAVEGSASDQDGSTSSYLDDDGNTDNTNKYKFTFSLPPGTGLGDLVTTTGTRANSTSEFSPKVVITAYTVITNRRVTYRIKSN